MGKNILIVAGTAVFALAAVAGALHLKRAMDAPQAFAAADPPVADLVATSPPEPPRADATVRVVLPATPVRAGQATASDARGDPMALPAHHAGGDSRGVARMDCAGGGAVAVVRARVYAPGSNIDREMDVMLMPGTWAAP